MAAKAKYKKINRNTRQAIQPFWLSPGRKFSILPEAEWPVRLTKPPPRPITQSGYTPSLLLLCPTPNPSIHSIGVDLPHAPLLLICLCILGPWVSFQNRRKEGPVLPINPSIRLTSLRLVLLRLPLIVISQSCFVPFILFYPVAATKAMRVICNRQGRPERPASAHWKMLEREV